MKKTMFLHPHYRGIQKIICLRRRVWHTENVIRITPNILTRLIHMPFARLSRRTSVLNLVQIYENRHTYSWEEAAQKITDTLRKPN